MELFIPPSIAFELCTTSVLSKMKKWLFERHVSKSFSIFFLKLIGKTKNKKKKQRNILS